MELDDDALEDEGVQGLDDEELYFLIKRIQY